MTTATLFTSGDLARLLGVSVRRVRHVLDTRPIQPVGRAGIVRLYDASAIVAVRRELKEAGGAATQPADARRTHQAPV